MQTAGLDHLLVTLLPIGLDLAICSGVASCRLATSTSQLPTKNDVGTATGHVSGDS
jgi:hypothetical protein